MDRGRMIDLKQNTNAVLIDRYEQSGRSIVKHLNPPGGKSNFSLGWGIEDKNEINNNNKNINNESINNYNNNNNINYNRINNDINLNNNINNSNNFNYNYNKNNKINE